MVSASDLKIYKTTNNLGGAITATQVTSATPNNVFTNIPKNELVVGEDYYACVYFKNTHPTEAMDNFKLWLTNKSSPPDTELKWDFDSLVNTLLFDGTDDYVDCTNDVELWSQALTKFSFSFWIFPTAGTDRQIVVHGAGAHRFNCELHATTSGTIEFNIRNAADTAWLFAENSTLLLNKWNHITCVYDSTLGSANVKIYVNKVVGTVTGDLTETVNNSATLRIGQTSNDFKGYMKDFRWWTTKALTQAEIDNVYSNSLLAPPADYWLKIDEGTGNPVDRISSTKIGTLNNGLSWQTNAQIIGTKYNGPFGMTTWNSLGSEPSTIAFTKLRATTSFPVWLWLHVNANAEARLDDSGLFAFKFGIPSGGTGTGGGGSGGDIGDYHYEPYGTFNGTTDFVEEAHAAPLNLNAFSMSAWFRTSKDYTVDVEDGTIISKGGVGGDTVGGNQNYGIRVFKDTNKIRAGFESNTFADGQDFEPASTMTVNDGQWHNVVCTHNPTDQEVKLYIDGVLDATMTTSGAVPETNTNPLRLGKNSKDSTRYFQGDIDEVYVWNVDLSDTEAIGIFSGGIPQSSAIVYSNVFGGSSGSGGGSGGTGGNPPPTPTDYKIAISGDWGCEPETDDIINLIQTEGYDFTVGVGDNAYEAAGCWTGRFDVLLPNFNSAYGNHEYSESGGISPYKTFFGHSLTYFTFKFENIQFFVIDTNIDSDVGSTQHNFISNALAASQNDSSIVWRIAVLHHPMYGSGSDHPYNEFNQRQNFHSLFQNNGVNFVCVGHNHNNQRTHQIAYNSSSTGSPNIIDSSSPYLRTVNAFIHVVTGTGGHDSGSSLYSLGSQPSYQAYQDRTMNMVWEIVASNGGNTLTCGFRDLNGDIHDQFVITA